jgi:phosphate transport system protein
MAPQHTDSEYEAELARLRQMLLLLGARAEAQLSGALECYAARDGARALLVIDADQELDRLEVETDAACMELLARRQPVARDLRFVVTALKIVTDLERIGDLACNAAQCVVSSVRLPREPSLDTAVQAMGREVASMLRDAIDALVESDATRAAAVISHDERVDRAYRALERQLVAAMSQRPGDIEALLRVLSLARSLERAADHCTNIAEMVVFLAKGHQVRHLRRTGGQR